MGWLDDLATACGHRSLRATAYAMRDEPGSPWPGDAVPQPESIANSLRDLDKRKNVQWWFGTGRSFVPALAFVLGESEAELLALMQEEVAPGKADGGPMLWIFSMFPALKPLDLRAEEPFPGVPRELLRRGGPSADLTWWVAPPGAGKSLVGQWLEARYGWTFVRGADWAEVRTELPDHGRVFVELGSTRGLDHDHVQTCSDSLRLCVACPTPPPEVDIDEAHGELWTRRKRRRRRQRQEEPDAARVWRQQALLVETPPPAQWMPALLDWCARRVTAGGGFDAEQVSRELDDPSTRSLFPTPGSALEFFGIIEKVGADAVFAPDVAEAGHQRWIRAWLRAALDRTDRKVPATVREHLRRHGPDVLSVLVQARWRADLPADLPLETWQQLAGTDRPVTLDRAALLALADDGSKEALARLREHLLADGAAVVDGLCALGALGGQDGTLRLQPPWLALVAATQAMRALLAGEAGDIGTLLLHREMATVALRHLAQDARSNDPALVRACCRADADTPEGAAAIDGAVRAVGWALAGGHRVDIDLVADLWGRQVPLLTPRFTNGPPLPLVSAAGADRREGLASWGAWLLAALSITRYLQAHGRPSGPAALDPWAAGTDPDPLLVSALPLVSMAFRDDDGSSLEQALERAAVGLGHHLCEAAGPIVDGGQVVDLMAPSVLVAHTRGAELDLPADAARHLFDLRFGLARVEQAAALAGVPLDDVLRACWAVWGPQDDPSRNCPPLQWTQRGASRQEATPDTHPDLARLWRVVEPEHLTDAFVKKLMDWRDVWPFLSATAWRRWLEVWAADEGRWARGRGAFAVMPEAIALDATRRGLLGPHASEIRSTLWTRCPEAMLELVDELVRLETQPSTGTPGAGDTVGELLWSAPDAVRAQLVDRTASWFEAPDDHPGAGRWVRRWWMATIERQSPGWRVAFRLVRTHGGGAMSA